MGAQLLGIKMANASLASLVNAMNPISIIIFASLILKEKFTVNKIVAVIAAVCSFPTAVYEYTTVATINLFRMDVFASVLYIGIVCTALTNLLWNKSPTMIDAGSCSLFYPIQPLVAALLGALLLGEKIGFSFIAGAVLIIGGVLFSISEDKKTYPHQVDDEMKLIWPFNL